MEDEDKDYITILDTVSPHHKLVVIMKHVGGGEYITTKTSERRSNADAEGLAKMWAAATGLEVR